MELQTGRKKSRITSLPLGNPEEVVSRVVCRKNSLEVFNIQYNRMAAHLLPLPTGQFLRLYFSIFFLLWQWGARQVWPHVAKILSLSSLQVGLRTGTRVSGFTHYKHIKHIYGCCLADLAVRFKRKRYVFRMCFFMLFDFCHEWIFHLSDNTLEETTTRPSRDISVCCVCSILTFYSFTFH